MSQCVKDIHRDLIIDDKWTEPHSPWQNPAKMIGVKYLKNILKYCWIGQSHQIIYGF
jgi:hypothetical protein